MNSKLLIFALLCFAGCGVKGDPIAPKEPPFPSVMENYPDLKVTTPLNETKRK